MSNEPTWPVFFWHSQGRQCIRHAQAGGPAGAYAECTTGALVFIDDGHPFVCGFHGASSRCQSMPVSAAVVVEVTVFLIAPEGATETRRGYCFSSTMARGNLRVPEPYHTRMEAGRNRWSACGSRQGRRPRSHMHFHFAAQGREYLRHARENFRIAPAVHCDHFIHAVAQHRKVQLQVLVVRSTGDPA